MERFSCKTKIIAGPGAMGELGSLGAGGLFLVTDPFFVKNGMARKVAQAVGADRVEVFDGVRPDPTAALAAEGTAKLKAFGPDLVVALGGGSAMDCAKAMVFFSGIDCTFAAIPTTSGSGSEVTDFAILTHDGVKHPLVDERLRPDLAILDSEVLAQLPPGLVADSGFDILAHALEAAVATDGGALTECLAGEAFATAYALLPDSFAGRTQVRLEIHRAATMAGMAFTNAGLGLCHAMAHALGGMFHVPHGRLNAILLPSVIDCNAHAAAGKYARVARAAGISGSAEAVAVRNLKNGLVRLRRTLSLPQTLAQGGIEPDQLRRGASKLVAATLADPCCATNPVPVDENMVRRILDEVAGNG